jgi:DNA polymerase epsilon subunit 3
LKANYGSAVLEFNEIQTDKRNTYRKKVAADKASGAKSGSPPREGGERNGVAAEGEGDGEPAAKKPRIDADADPDGAGNEVEDASDLLDEGELGEDGGEEAEEEGDVEDLEEDAGEEEVEEPPEDGLEENEERDGGDEALDNGEDSD